ncbi:MAG TPA: HAMP domain-containing sensor histidine kinase [Spirochaetia bacterium]|nr:HAMP domain-containing sensor histidine kinase [Spirochaetia bacterium]
MTAADGLQVVLFLTYFCNALLAVLLAWTGRSFPGAWLWVLAQGLLALGTLFDTLPAGVPTWIPLVIGNSAYIAASLVYSHSVWSFRFGGRFPREFYLFVPAIVLSFFLVRNEPHLVRSLVFSTWMAVGALTTSALLLWKVDRRYWVSNGLTALPFLFLGGVSAFRLVHLVELPGSLDESVLTEVNVWYVGGAILLSTVTLFGYFMMAALRASQVMAEKDAEIEARNRKLEESGRAKDLFFSIIAHDLRGPIGGAARYTRKHLLGKMSGLEAKYTEVETLASALEKTYEFLEKLLWWSRAQLQDWAPDRRAFDLVLVIEASVNLVRPAADLKQISLVHAITVRPQPVADPESVQLILGNLLANAVKFSLPGREVRVEVTLDEERCRITVVDSGVGMDRATLARLFRIEDKLTTHGTSGERGSGLGLLLAHSLAERNGGGIVMESQPGVGTRATLWLPLTASG